MAMTFDQAFDRLMMFEGGYSNDSRDAGGETKFGISKAAYPDVDIANLTKEEARHLYFRDYWAPLQLDQLPESVRYPLFDFAVNSGKVQAVKTLQQTLDLTDDGILGPRTIRAASECKNLLAKFLSNRLLFLCNIKSFDTFGRGWTRRVAQVLLENVDAG